MLKTNTKMVKDFFETSQKNIVIDDIRKELLLKIANKIAVNYNNNDININFICTHNSRRSQLGQVWSFFAADYFKLPINAFSGGTEVTAFHRNTVKTLTEVGFKFDVDEFSHTNPIYRISFSDDNPSLLGFSKLYNNIENKTPYFVLTTCNNADENCPFIPEAIDRFHVPYIDPKHSDDSAIQDETYLKTSGIIAAQMYYLFNEIKKLL
jgi:arsenate reductase